jgi:hypothetical protein
VDHRAKRRIAVTNLTPIGAAPRLSPFPSPCIFSRENPEDIMTRAKTLSLSAFALLTTLAASASAQPPALPAPAQAGVSVTGTGEIKVAPDMAVITAEATFTRKTVKEAAAETRKSMDAIVKAGRKAARSSDDLRTGRLSVNPEYDWTDGKRIFRGYTASQSLEITIRDLSKVESLTEDLFAAPVTGLGGLQMMHSGADSLRREALALAVRDARDNAAKICAAAGRSCSEAVAIRMQGASAPPMPMYVEARAFKAADAGGGAQVEAGLLTFSASVDVDYRMK